MINMVKMSWIHVECVKTTLLSPLFWFGLLFGHKNNNFIFILKGDNYEGTIYCARMTHDL